MNECCSLELCMTRVFRLLMFSASIDLGFGLSTSLHASEYWFFLSLATTEQIINILFLHGGFKLFTTKCITNSQIRAPLEDAQNPHTEKAISVYLKAYFLWPVGTESMPNFYFPACEL